MKLLFITKSLRNILEKAFVKGHYRTNPKTKEPYWVDDYYDKRKLKHVESVAPKQKKRVNKSEQELSHKKKQLESELAYLDIHEHEAISSHGSKYKKDKLHGKDYYAGHSLDEVRNNFRIQRAKLENEMKQIEADMQVVGKKKEAVKVATKKEIPEGNLKKEAIAKMKLYGKEWKGYENRIYFDFKDVFGVEINYYGSGNVSSATQSGEKISNSEAKYLLRKYGDSRFWYDPQKSEFKSTGLDEEDIQKFTNYVKINIGKELFAAALSKEETQIDKNEAANVIPLPSLKGSDKQVTWASSIRDVTLKKLNDFLKSGKPLRINELEFEKTDIESAIEKTRSQASASWWIDNRQNADTEILKKFVDVTEKSLPPLKGTSEEIKEATQIRSDFLNQSKSFINQNIQSPAMIEKANINLFNSFRGDVADNWIYKKERNLDPLYFLKMAKFPSGKYEFRY